MYISYFRLYPFFVLNLCEIRRAPIAKRPGCFRLNSQTVARCRIILIFLEFRFVMDLLSRCGALFLSKDFCIYLPSLESVPDTPPRKSARLLLYLRMSLGALLRLRNRYLAADFEVSI